MFSQQLPQSYSRRVRKNNWYNSINPPLPTSQQPSSSDSTGQRLLSLLKNLPVDKSNDSNDTDTNEEDNERNYNKLEEILTIIQGLIVIVQRRGLLRGNISLAKQVLDYTTNTSTSTGFGGGGGGRKNRNSSSKNKRCSRSNNDLSIQLNDSLLDNNNNGNSTSGMATLDVQLLMSAIERVMDHQQFYSNNTMYFVLIAATADLVAAASIYVLQSTSSTPSIENDIDFCFLAEYELLASSGKTLLSNIEKHLRHTILSAKSSTKDEASNHNIDDDDTTSSTVKYYMIASCQRTAVSLISLFGTKLSRSTSVILGLRDMAWHSIQLLPTTIEKNNTFLQKAATTLIATIPIAGCVGGSSSSNSNTNATHTEKLSAPSMLWNQTLLDTVTVLTYTLRYVTPIVDMKYGNNKKLNVDITQVSEFVKQIVTDQWIPSIQQSSNEEMRMNMFLHVIHGLVGIVIALFTRESLGIGNATATISSCSQLINAEINIDLILSLIEMMLSYTTASENKFYATKKRLRQENITGGLLSPNNIVGKVAMSIRILGHELFNVIITSIGSCSLLPYARRIFKISYHAISSSSSTTVRRMIDPTTAILLDQKRERWLHTSVIARIEAIQSFQCIVQSFGTDAHSMTGSIGDQSRNGCDFECSISFICGTMIDELTSTSTSHNSDWGTMNDRAKLILTITSCLAASLNCGGSFLSPTIRGLVDMVASTSLSCILNNQPITSFAEVKAAILHFGVAAVCTPWQDGATSSIAIELTSAAQISLQATDGIVVTAATMALNVCQGLTCNRVPPLQVVTRSNDFHSNRISNVVTSETIEEKIHLSRNEVDKSKIVAVIDQTETTESKKPKSDNKYTVGNSSPVLTTSGVVDAEVTSTPEIQIKSIKKFDIVTVPNNKTQSQVDTEQDSKPILDTMDDDGFPMIIDCGPDEDDL
jgi:hypothetical protein